MTHGFASTHAAHHAAAMVGAVVLVAGCASACSSSETDADADRTVPSSDAPPTPTTTAATTTTSATPITARPATTSTSATSTTAGQTSGRTDRSVLRTDGGTVTVERRGDALQIVDLVTSAGWEVAHEFVDAAHLEVRFDRDDDHVTLSVVLTATGISSSVRAVSG